MALYHAVQLNIPMTPGRAPRPQAVVLVSAAGGVLAVLGVVFLLFLLLKALRMNRRENRLYNLIFDKEVTDIRISKLDRVDEDSLDEDLEDSELLNASNV